jgi:hypothetical protein
MAASPAPRGTIPPPAAGHPNSWPLEELEALAELLTPATPELIGSPPQPGYEQARGRARLLQKALRRIGVEVRTRTWAERDERGQPRWCWAVYLRDG